MEAITTLLPTGRHQQDKPPNLALSLVGEVSSQAPCCTPASHPTPVSLQLKHTLPKIIQPKPCLKKTLPSLGGSWQYAAVMRSLPNFQQGFAFFCYSTPNWFRGSELHCSVSTGSLHTSVVPVLLCEWC